MSRRNTSSIEVVAKETKKNSFSLWMEGFIDQYGYYTFSWSSVTIIFHRLLSFGIAIWLAVLSYPVLVNIISPEQVMNRSFDPFRIVNTYGAFGSITKTRHEVFFAFTNCADIIYSVYLSSR